MALSSCEATRF